MAKSRGQDVTSRLKTQVEARKNGAAHVALKGELDLATVGIAEDALKQARSAGTALVLDLRELSFLDSSGLRLILTAADQGELFVVRGPAQVDRVLELTGAAERLNLVDDPSLIDRR